MIENLSPVAAVLVILFGALFGVLFLTWCCKQCSEAHSLHHIHRASSGTRGYWTVIDVQTGLPVVIAPAEAELRAAENAPISINSAGYATLYGTLVRDPYHTTVDPVARTPPPPYFETDRLLRTVSI